MTPAATEIIPTASPITPSLNVPMTKSVPVAKSAPVTNTANTGITDAEAINIETTAKQPAPTSQRSIMEYPADYYAVQLIAAHNQGAIDYFLQQHPHLNTQQLSSNRNNQRWLSLIVGVYPSLQAANQAIADITPPLVNKPWVRRLGPLQRSL